MATNVAESYSFVDSPHPRGKLAVWVGLIASRRVIRRLSIVWTVVLIRSEMDELEKRILMSTMNEDREMEEEEQSFIIQCHDGSFEVSSEKCRMIFESCEYFRIMFRHGMKESQERVLQKPDWDMATAAAVVGVLSAKEDDGAPTPLSTIATAINLQDAFHQIQEEVSFFPPNLVSAAGIALSEEQLTKVTNCVTKAEDWFAWRLETKCRIDERAWFRLIDCNILIHENDAILTAKKPVPGIESTLDLVARLLAQSVPEPLYRLRQLSCRCLPQKLAPAILQLRDAFQHKTTSSTKVFTNQKFSIRFAEGPGFSAFKHFKESIEKGTTVRVQLHQGTSLGYYLNGSNSSFAFTVMGTLKELRYVLSLIKSTNPDDHRCSLRITAPKPHILEGLIKGVCLCEKHTLGVSFASNAYFAVKTLQDMSTILDYLVHPEATPNVPITNFELHDLAYPKGVF